MNNARDVRRLRRDAAKLERIAQRIQDLVHGAEMLLANQIAPVEGEEELTDAAITTNDALTAIVDAMNDEAEELEFSNDVGVYVAPEQETRR